MIDEHDLQADFDALRQRDRERLPAFDSILHAVSSAAQSPAPARSGAWHHQKATWWLAAAGVLVAVSALLVHRTARSRSDVDAVLGDTAMLRRLSVWSAPTDGLLQLTDVVITSSTYGGAARSPSGRHSSTRN
jgi:hypothetical protein